MPVVKKINSNNVAIPTPLSADQQAMLDNNNRLQQLNNMYAKYSPDPSVKPVDTSTIIQEQPQPNMLVNALRGFINMVSPSTQAPATEIAAPTMMSDADALKLNTEAGQLAYLNQNNSVNKKRR